MYKSLFTEKWKMSHVGKKKMTYNMQIPQRQIFSYSNATKCNNFTRMVYEDKNVNKIPPNNESQAS